MTNEVDDARALKMKLAQLEDEGWELYLRELRRLDGPEPEALHDTDWDTPEGQWRRSDPGHPLGPGMPTGSPIGDEVPHMSRWMALLRKDPCVYCGQYRAGTVDHIEPKNGGDASVHLWDNMAGACANCNSRKSDRPLLLYLLGWKPPAAVERERRRRENIAENERLRAAKAQRRADARRREREAKARRRKREKEARLRRKRARREHEKQTRNRSKARLREEIVEWDEGDLESAYGIR